MSTTPDPLGGIGSLIAGVLGSYVLIVLIVSLLGALINYLMIKAAVRNGVIEAIKKTGLDSRSSGIISGYPPQSGYAAPAAPIAEKPYNPYEF